MITVFVVDDQDIVRDGLVTVLSLLDDVTVIGSASNGADAVAAVQTQQPDIVLMDLRMPGMDGADATAAIVAAHPEVAVLVLTTYADDVSIASALRAGARGYLTKDASRADIAAALRSVARGQSTFDSGVSARLISRLGLGAGPSAGPATPTVSGLKESGLKESGLKESGLKESGLKESGLKESGLKASGLTVREREVFRLIGAGLNNSEIADRLFVSTSTVKTHINNLFAKLQIRDRPHAVLLAGETFGLDQLDS